MRSESLIVQAHGVELVFRSRFPMLRPMDPIANARRLRRDQADEEKQLWHGNREGVLLEIWNALHRRTGCEIVMGKTQSQRYAPPPVERLAQAPGEPS